MAEEFLIVLDDNNDMSNFFVAPMQNRMETHLLI